MNKYIVLGVMFITTPWPSMASTLYSTDITLTYLYGNDLQSRSAGLVPKQLNTFVSGKPTTIFPLTIPQNDTNYSVSFNTCFVSSKPTIAIERIVDAVVDKFELGEFVKLRVYYNDNEIIASEVLLCALHKAHLNITYDPEDNTPEEIQARRINWIIEKTTGVPIASAWGNRADRERLRKVLTLHYFDIDGSPKSMEELQKIAFEALFP